MKKRMSDDLNAPATKADLRQLAADLQHAIERVETSLLTEFHNFEERQPSTNR
jgi:hypothetical protein